MKRKYLKFGRDCYERGFNRGIKFGNQGLIEYLQKRKNKSKRPSGYFVNIKDVEKYLSRDLEV